MKLISRQKVILLVVVFVYMQWPASISNAQGYFPDVTLAKPIQVPKSARIKFREDWLYRFENGKMSPQGLLIGYDRFDSLGRKIEEANYDLSGKALLEVTYTYDEWGREIQCLGLKEKENFYRKWEYSFNDSLKCLIKTVYNNPFNKQRWVYHFDSVGNIFEEESFNANGEFNYRYKITYTKFGKPAELIEYSGNGTMYEKWIYLYNQRNQNIEVMQFDANGELFKKFQNKFDNLGNMKEVYTLDKYDKELERTISVYQFFK
jgi:hypothetical protein